MRDTPAPLTAPGADAATGRCLTIVAWAAPAALLALVTLIYLASPEFYLRYMLEEKRRETQAVEIATFLFGAAAAALLVWSSVALWRLERSEAKIRGLPGGPLIVAVVALATIFFTGEEASWGQSYLRWKTPELFSETLGSHETNFHNADAVVSVQMLGSMFLVLTFLALPLLWRFRCALRLPADWASGVAEGPVVFTFLCGFVWTRAKGVYRATTTAEQREESLLYAQFIDQMKEHKEMVFALGLLLYGVYRVRLVRRLRAERAAASPL